MPNISNYQYLKLFEQISKGNDYMTLIPKVTRDNITEVGNAILSYEPTKEAFYNVFMTKILMQIINGLDANNKFAPYKSGNVIGDIEEAYVDYIGSRAYDPEDETLLKNVKASITNLYHKVDRKTVRETSISDDQLRDAFLTENGLSSLGAQVLSTLYSSQEHDEYVMIKELFNLNIKHATKPMQKVVITGANAKEKADNLLYAIKRDTARLSYVKKDYNTQGLMMRTPESGQILVLHEDYKLNIDMGSLPNIFNLDKVELKTNTITVDDFNADEENIIAVLVDKRAIQYRDRLRKMTSFYNPQTLTTKYFLHVWLLVSMSYIFNMVYYVEGEDTPEPNPEG